MANEKQTALAKSVYETICKALDLKKWKYDGKEDKLEVCISFNGDDIPMDFIVQVDADRQIVSLLSFLPFDIVKEKRIDLSLATCYINYVLADGSFDLSLADGTILFRMTSSYRGSLLSKDMFINMINVACFLVDEYNDKLKALNDGDIDLKEFMHDMT